MKLQHNLGGIEQLGPVSTETRPFVEEWEKRIFGIHVAMMALSAHLKDSLPGYRMAEVPTAFKHDWTWGHLRMGAEAMNPFDYFKFRYYEKWLGGISSFFVEQGYVDGEELKALSARYLAGKPPPPPTRSSPGVDEQVLRYLREGDSPKRERAGAPKFKVGDQVLVNDVHPVEHTRLPGYLRGKTGKVTFVYDDAYAYFFSTGPDGIGGPMPVYVVEFDPRAIWGEMSEPGSLVYADLFQAYLLPAS